MKTSQAVGLVLLPLAVFGQTPPQPKQPDVSAPALFKSRVELVTVPVVVRDGRGSVIASLEKQDFQLFDRGKQQEIQKFSVERAAGTNAVLTPGSETAPSEKVSALPERYIAYIFDDMHMDFSDLVRSRDAVSKQLGELPPHDRAGLFTTSGQNQLDFTSDLAALRAGLLKLRNRGMVTGGVASCPDLSYYQSDLIVNHSDADAMRVAVADAAACGMTGPGVANSIRGMARGVLSMGRYETTVTFDVLQGVVKRMSTMPGQRIVVLASPGFIHPEQTMELGEIIDRAVQSSVVINSLDARGLFTLPMADASKRGSSAEAMRIKQSFEHTVAMAQEDVLAELAYGTGGSFFHNNNDLLSGFRELANIPDVHYLLAFAPQDLKADGAYHSLKVKVKAAGFSGVNLVARKGYYAPGKNTPRRDNANEEIDALLYSRQMRDELPVELLVQGTRLSDLEANIMVLCRLDLKRLEFRKEDGRNYNTLQVVSGLYDRNGNLVKSVRRTIELKLKDETLATINAQGQLSLKTDILAPPGEYTVRLVVRDSLGQMMSAKDTPLVIP